MSVFVFGEVLWDVYPEKKVMGGAPFNFAAHLNKLGQESYLITAVGKDALGSETLQAIDTYGLNKDFISETDFPTGICSVTVSDEGIPNYDLCPGRAYDNIPLNDEQKAFLGKTKNKSLYFGSLAQRNEASANTLRQLIDDYEWDNVFFDINIRQNYYTKEIAEQGFRACTVLKISNEEFPVLAKLGICDISPENGEEACKFLADKYDIKTVILTLGKDGAMCFTNGKCYVSEVPKGKVVSTVGAGDSFFAAYTNALLRGKTARVCLSHAVKLSDFVVQNLESVPEYTEEIINYLSE